MTEVIDLVGEMLVLTATLLVPWVLAAAAGGTAGALVASWLGLQDPALAALLRAVAAVVAVAATGAAGFEETVAFTKHAWSGLARVGREGVSSEPGGS